MGRAPATNLAKADTLKAKRFLNQESKLSVEVVPNMMAVSNISQYKVQAASVGHAGPVGQVKATDNPGHRMPSPVTWSRKVPPPRKDEKVRMLNILTF